MKSIIEKGDRFGRLTAVRFDHRDKRYKQYWLFKCICGNEKIISVDSVKSKHTMSCGCLNRTIIKSGDKYNYLIAIKFVEMKKQGQHWLFKCECGCEKVICVNSVKTMGVKSCGCLHKKTIKIQGKKNKTHGMFGTKTYHCWSGMKSRCLDKNHKVYKHYGGRGITVCDEWLIFENFYKDMGDCPKRMSLDRIDNNGNYTPKNCRYATPKQQSNNTRRNHLITYNNKTQTVSQWAEELKINYNFLYNRIYRNWSIERALTFNIKL